MKVISSLIERTKLVKGDKPIFLKDTGQLYTQTLEITTHILIKIKTSGFYYIIDYIGRRVFIIRSGLFLYNLRDRLILFLSRLIREPYRI